LHKLVTLNRTKLLEVETGKMNRCITNSTKFNCLLS